MSGMGALPRALLSECPTTLGVGRSRFPEDRPEINVSEPEPASLLGLKQLWQAKLHLPTAKETHQDREERMLRLAVISHVPILWRRHPEVEKKREVCEKYGI